MVYVDPSCRWCQRALETVFDCRALLERVRVEVREVAAAASSELVGAVPAFSFRGQLLHLGTPDCDALLRTIEPLLPIDEGGGARGQHHGVESHRDGQR